MKLAITCGHQPTFGLRMGWGRVFQTVGIPVSILNEREKPAFDFFSEVEPDYLFVHTSELSRAIVKNLATRPNLKVALWGSNWGSFDSEILPEDGDLLAQEHEKKLVELLKQVRPDISTIFAPYSQQWTEITHDRWVNLGMIPVGSPPAGDTVLYGQGKYDPLLECDVAFIGNPSPRVNAILLPLCHESAGLRVKIFGGDGWSVAQYLGGITPATARNLFATAKICPNIVGKPYRFCESERPYQALLSGGFVISVDSDTPFTDEELVTCAKEDFLDCVLYFLTHTQETISFVENGLQAVLKGHTYLHRVNRGMEAIGSKFRIFGEP